MVAMPEFQPGQRVRVPEEGGGSRMKVLIAATVTVLVFVLAGSIALNVYYYTQAESLVSRLETANVGFRFQGPDSPSDVLKISEVNRHIGAVIRERDRAVVALREIEREMHDPRNFGLRWGDAIMRISPFFIGGS